MEIFTADNYNSALVRMFANYTRATQKGIVRFVALTPDSQAALGITEVSMQPLIDTDTHVCGQRTRQFIQVYIRTRYAPTDRQADLP
jgi:hypothetical protein